MWVELVIAFLAEGYRELVEWWQTRPNQPFRARSASDSEPGEGVPASPKAPSLEIGDTVETIIERHGRKHVGVAVGIWLNGETRTFARGRLGSDRPAAPGPKTIFEIGSVTKVFTALLLEDMAHDGLVALDDPVQRYLPRGVVVPVRGRPITLLDLATHTSGLPRLPKALFTHSLWHRANPYAGFTTEQLERAIAETRLKRRPGEKIRYSNFGFGVLGCALARRAGTSYEHLVHERICKPLGLDDTGISIRGDARQRLADGHNRKGRKVPHWDLPALPGAGALRSTVADLLRFVEHQLTEPRTRLDRAARATHAPRAHRGALVQCLGWVGLPLRGSDHLMLWHHGGTGGFRSFVGIVGEADVGVVVLSNSSRSVDAIGFRTLEAMTALSAGHARADYFPSRTRASVTGA